MNEPLTIRVFGRRRNILVNSPYQHRLSLITTLLALIPPSIFFAIYYLITSEGSRRIVQANPALEQLVRGQDRTESLLILAAVLFYGMAVYLVTLMESHRTAGFLHRVDHRLRELKEGHYGGDLRPRRDDNFAFLAQSINSLSTELQSRAGADLAVLDEIGETVETLLAGMGPGMIRGRDRLVELRSRIEALRCLKRSHLEDGRDAVPVPMTQVSDQKKITGNDELVGVSGPVQEDTAEDQLKV